MLPAVSTVGFGQANTTLSNLNSPIAINLSLTPANNNGLSLGSISKSWRILYIDSSVYLKDSLFLHNKGTRNSFTGERAGYSITTASDNAAFGYHALYADTTTSYNSAFGSLALAKNTSSYNSAFGYQALNGNTRGKYNTASGAYALRYNDTGSYNTAYGYASLYINKGSYNTAIGYNSLYVNVSGINNTAAGFNALASNGSGLNNTATGAFAMRTNSSGRENVATGYNALWSNSTGGYNTSSGSQSMYHTTSGSGNAAYGFYSLPRNTTGGRNVAIGYNALYFHTTQSYNVAIGSDAGDNTTGTYNTYVGAKTQLNTSGYTNSTCIGYNSRISASNQVVLGNSSITSIKAGTGFVIYSDGRYKNNIKENVPGLEFIRMLKPVTYNYNIHGLNAKIDGDASAGKHDDTGDDDDAERLAADEKAATEKEKIIYTGLVAQEVEKAANKLGYNFSGIYKPQNDNDVYGLSYADFVMPLIKGMQELDQQNQQLKQNNQTLETRVTQLEKMVQQLAQTKGITGGSYLSQNIPNPSNGNTVIPFQIAHGSHIASVQIVETGSGKIVKTIPVDANATQVSVNTSSFAAGTYFYSLIVDGKNEDSKQMILSNR